MGILTRGLIGGIGGYMLTGDVAGAGIGAAGGILGGKGLGNFAKLGSVGRGISGRINTGLGMMTNGLHRGSNYFRRMSGGQSGYKGLAASRGASAINSIEGVVGNAMSFVGRSSSVTNKYGGYAMGAIGTAAAAHIGSSVLKSNSNRSNRRNNTNSFPAMVATPGFRNLLR